MFLLIISEVISETIYYAENGLIGFNFRREKQLLSEDGLEFDLSNSTESSEEFDLKYKTFDEVMTSLGWSKIVATFNSVVQNVELRETRAVTECEVLSFREDNVVTFTSKEASCPSVVIIVSSSYEIDSNFTNFLQIQIPDEFRGDTFTIIINTPGSEQKISSFYLEYNTYCKSYNCYMCADNLLNFSCHDTAHNAFLFFFWMFILGLLLVILNLLYRVFGCTIITGTAILSFINQLKKIFTKSKASKFVSNKAKKVYHKTLDTFSEDKEDAPEVVIIPKKANSVKDDVEGLRGREDKKESATQSSSKYTKYALVFMFLLCVTTSNACSNQAVAIQSGASSCFTDGSHRVCTYNKTLDIFFDTIEDEFCVDLMDEDKIFGMVKITLEAVKIKTNMRPLYDTCNWSPTTTSYEKCYDFGVHCSESLCASCCRDRSAYGYLNGKAINGTGESRCDTVDGTFSDLCIAGDFGSSCLFSAWSIECTSAPITVYALDYDETFYEYTISSRLGNSNYSLNSSINSLHSNQFSLGGIIFKMVNPDPVLSTIPPDSNYKFVKYENDLSLGFFALASEPNSPTRSQFGDVQFNHRNQNPTRIVINPQTGCPYGKNKYGECIVPTPQTRPTHYDEHSMIFDQDILSFTAENSIAKYTFRQPGFSYAKREILPVRKNNINWSMSSGSVIGTYLNAIPMNHMQIIFGNYPIVSTTTAICLSDVSFTNLTGCYDCNLGAVINAVGYSTCTAGLINLNITSEYCTLESKGYFLTTNSSKILIPVYCSRSLSSGKVCLISNTNAKCITFSGTLFAPLTEISESSDLTLINGTEPYDPEISLLDFEDWISNIFSSNALKWVFIILIIILGTLGVIVLILTFIFLSKTSPALRARSFLKRQSDKAFRKK